MRRFSFEEFGRVYLPIYIKPYESETLFFVKFKVDTGADKSTISKFTLSNLGYSNNVIKQNTVLFKDSDKPTTAAGDKVNAGCIQLPLINFLGYEGKH